MLNLINPYLKTKLIYLLACLLLLINCTDKGSDEPTPELPCELTEVRNSGGDEVWQQVTYNAEARTVSYIIYDGRTYAKYKVSISYDEAGRRKEVLSEWINGPVEDKKKTVYRYNTAGAIDTVYLHQLKGLYGVGVSLVFVHTYNQQNQLTEIKQKRAKDGQMEDVAVFLFFYEGKQLSRREDYEVGYAPFRVIYHLQFDNKKRPDHIGILPHLSGLDDYSYLCDFLMPSQHNLTSFRVVSAMTGETAHILSFTNTYTYSEQGYPVYQETKYFTGPKKTFTYAYKCQ